ASLKFLLICGVSAAVYCEHIDYRKAEEIFSNLLSAEEFNDDFQYRRIFTNPVVRFTTFMRDHDKVYASKDELFERHENFEDNVEMVEDLSLADRGTARYGINKFSDLSVVELLQMTGLNAMGIQKELFGSSQDNRTGLEKQAIQKLFNWKRNEPRSLDWRDKGVISKVKDQGNCQCCWAFSSVGVVEAVNAIENEALVELSVQQLVDCDKSNDGCNGGLMDYAFDYIINNGGVESEKDYPYKGVKSSQGCKANAADEKTKFTLKNYTRIPEGEEGQMKKWVAHNGPLSVGINARGLFFYDEGIIDLDERMCNPYEQNHAIIVVGYGEERKYGETIPYWIVRNSWGEDWGEKGYFRMKRGANTCGISEYVHGVEVKKEEKAKGTKKLDNNGDGTKTLWDILDCVKY
ncbi:hypothetical protein WDU94_000691, partial [Cyamophila willieti]